MKLLSFILCDDIRSETGNKHSLMGVYDNSIDFRVLPSDAGKWPRVLKIGIFARFGYDDNKEISAVNKFKVYAEFKDEINTIIGGTIQMENNALNKITFAIVIPQFVFKNEGNLSISFEFFDANDKSIVKIPVPEKIKISESKAPK